MRHRVCPLLLWLCAFHFLPFCHGQSEPQVLRKTPALVPALQEPVHLPGAATLLDGTEISLRLVAPVKIKEAEVGDKVPFVLYHNLYYRNILLAKAGENVEAQIVEAVKARWASRGSKLAINITGLKLLNGQTLPLRGYSLHSGAVGNAPGVADNTIKTGSEIACPMCGSLFEPAAVIFFLASGSNRDIKEDTSAPAYVDGNFALDLSSFGRSQSKETSAKGTVRVVRGHYGWPYKRDLYCNGAPLVYLSADHRFELTVDPGYYRFAINSKKPPVQIYVAPGTTTSLIATHDEISVLGEKDVSVNTKDVFLKPFGKPKSAGDLLKQAKAVDEGDIYSTTCSPLSEVFDAATASDVVSVPSKPSQPSQPTHSQPD